MTVIPSGEQFAQDLPRRGPPLRSPRSRHVAVASSAAL